MSEHLYIMDRKEESIKIKTIVQRFPLKYGRYIEVFGGAGWVLFYKKPEELEVYYDYNSNLTNLFHVVKYKPIEFIKEIG